MSGWDESKVKRDWHGRFSPDLVGKWAVQASRRFNDHGLKRGDERPPGFEAAIARNQELWNIPDRRRGIERTDEQQAELEELEAGFETYRKLLGATEEDRDSRNVFRDPVGRRFDRYGRFQGGGFPLSRNVRAKSRAVLVKEDRASRRYEDGSSVPADRERRSASEGGKIGYARYGTEGAPEFLAYMKRAKARARVEGSSRTPVRRTPRGTQVDGWMSKVNDRINRGGGAR